MRWDIENPSFLIISNADWKSKESINGTDNHLARLFLYFSYLFEWKFKCELCYCKVAKRVDFD